MILAKNKEIRPAAAEIGGKQRTVFRFQTVVIGTGAAGFNAADTLYSLGHTDIAILTEGLNMGTSRNTGSDKQTYYKLTLAGAGEDSIEDMAKTLFAGGSMHGDIALVEAAMSAACFYKLVNIGVKFPHNKYGEYIGYKTDHDPRQRATSCGPLTSKFMTEQLQKAVMQKDIPIFDGYRVVEIVTKDGSAVGLVAIDAESGEQVLFSCTNVVYATGGPSGIYHASVYPQSQTCATGTALAAGAKGINVTESQYGIASTKFRWNLSGTYQQVIPTYISTEQDGSDPKEFLDDYFETTADMVNAIFLKGYQWPFDPRKLQKGGSSIVDIAVFTETNVKKRRVFLDFRCNPAKAGDGNGLKRELMNEETFSYLEKSGALLAMPIQRLRKMNNLAYDLYRSNGIDLETEMLEIAVCAQHNNGGLMGNTWYESNIRHLFPVGEVNGTFGVYRPGGTALNSTQVGSTRAAQYISANYSQDPLGIPEFSAAAAPFVERTEQFLKDIQAGTGESPFSLREAYQKRMDACGAFIRPEKDIGEAIEACRKDIADIAARTNAKNPTEVLGAFINRDILYTQYTYLSAIQEYIRQGGRSRGSYLIGEMDISNCAQSGVRTQLDNDAFSGKACEVAFHPDTCSCSFEWAPVRLIPERDDWFENVYNAYLNGEIIR